MVSISVFTDKVAFFSLPAFVLLLVFAQFLQGCVREQMDSCMQYELTVKAVDPQGVDVTSSGTVTSIDLYLFDEDGFVRTIPRGSSSDFLFGEEKNKRLTLVAWGNLKGDSLKLPQLSVGTSLQEAKIELLQTANGYSLPVTDLFYTRRELSGTSTRSLQSDTVKLVMERLAAGLSVRVSHAAEYFSSSNVDLHMVVRGTGSALNFLGEPSDDEAGYAPPMQAVSGKDEWYAPLFRVFPTNDDQHICIDLYKDSTLLFTITTDDDGNILKALSGVETYITVDFHYARLHVTVSVEPWGTNEQDVQI
jgi:hypothetical protein